MICVWVVYMMGSGKYNSKNCHLHLAAVVPERTAVHSAYNNYSGIIIALEILQVSQHM